MGSCAGAGTLLHLKRVIAERFGVDFHPRYVGKLLKKLGFSHISARPRPRRSHPRPGRGWHTTGKLDVPDNITPIFLPSRAPELNPVENVWHNFRQNWLSNTVFENYDAIVDAACAAWRKLIAQPETITSIGMRDCRPEPQPATGAAGSGWRLSTDERAPEAPPPNSPLAI